MPQQRRRISHHFAMFLALLSIRQGRTFVPQQRRIMHPHQYSSSSSSSLLYSTTTTTHTQVVVDLPVTEFTSSSHHHSTSSPVILLHGLLGNKKNFATIGQSLASQLTRKRRVLAFDLRNHGDNQRWIPDMSYASMAADVLHTMERHRIQNACLVGHSVGGKVAKTLALTHPDRVDGLCVLDIAPVQYTTDEPHWKAVSDIVETLVRVSSSSSQQKTELLSKRQVDVLLRSDVPDPALRAFLLTNFDSQTNSWKIPISIIQQELDKLSGFDVPSTNDNKYHGDAFFIHGGQSRFVRHSHIESIQSYFPNHMLTTIRGAGHWVHAEAPDDTIALLKKYLDR